MRREWVVVVRDFWREQKSAWTETEVTSQKGMRTAADRWVAAVASCSVSLSEPFCVEERAACVFCFSTPFWVKFLCLARSCYGSWKNVWTSCHFWLVIFQFLTFRLPKSAKYLTQYSACVGLTVVLYCFILQWKPLVATEPAGIPKISVLVLFF